jgi:ABC-type sugar transport system ATPase subunit
MSRVILEKVVEQYGETKVIHEIDLFVEDKEFGVLVGPSGCHQTGR